MHVLAIVHDVVPIVIANNLYTEFPNDSSLITFMLTGPGLLLVVSSIITGRLLEKVSYKVMLLIGCALFAVAATLGTFVPNALYMAVMRGLVGVATGIVNVAGISMITSTIVDEGRRSPMIGYYNGASSAFGMVLGLVAGWLATLDWQFAFYSYVPSILIFVFVLIFVPNVKPVAQATEEQAGGAQKKESLGVAFWVFMFVYVLYDMACIPFGYYNSLYVAEHALGNEAFGFAIRDTKAQRTE